MSTHTASLNQSRQVSGRRRSRTFGLNRRRQILGALFTLPTAAMITIFFLVPLGMTFWMSFYRWPLLGQHNRDVAARLGYSSGEIDALVADGVLYAEPAVERLHAS